MIKIETTVFNTDGKEIGVYSSGKKGLFPTCSKQYYTDITGLQPGEYKAVLLAKCDSEEIFGVNVSLIVKQ